MGLKAVASSLDGQSASDLLNVAVWDSGTTYPYAAFVKIGANGTVLYQSLQDANTGHNPASGAPWWKSTSFSSEMTDVLTAFPH